MQTKKGRFRINGFDQDGRQRTRENTENHNKRPAWRLVCRMEGGGKIAIWGEEGAMHNIEKVEQAGDQCTVECEWQDPEPWGRQFGHTHWVSQKHELCVVSME